MPQELDPLLEPLKRRKLADLRRKHPDIDGQIAQVLADLEMLPWGSVQSWNSAGGHSDESHAMPPPDRYPHDTFRKAYHAAAGDETKLPGILDAAVTELVSWRPPPRASIGGETQAELDARIVEKNGWTVKDVANWSRASETQVRAARRAAGRDPEFGERVEKRETLAEAQRRQEVERLRRPPHNLSYRQIAAKLGVGLATIHRDLAA